MGLTWDAPLGLFDFGGKFGVKGLFLQVVIF